MFALLPARHFLWIPLALSVVGLAAAWATPTQQGSAGVRGLFNAVIYTVDSQRPLATAMAWTEQGELLAVGSDAEVMQRFPDLAARDLGGQTVLPGLIDAHGHIHGLADTLSQVDLRDTGSLAEVRQRLLEFEKKLEPGEWLLGGGWDQNNWPGAEFPNRGDLDDLFGERPVWLRRIDGHAGWANSAALAQIDRDLTGDWQPQGGLIHRDIGGSPTGILIDSAQVWVDDRVPEPSDSLRRDALELALQRLSAAGLTGVHDAGLDWAGYQRYERLIRDGKFPLRVNAMADGVGETMALLCREGAQKHDSGLLGMRTVKLYADGALGSRGAALLEDYSDDPGNRGLLFEDSTRLREQVGRVLACGLQAAVHAIGDHANREVLDALEHLGSEHSENPGRHRIEHAQVLHPDDLQRFSSLGVIASIQPTHATSDMDWAERRLGPDRVPFAYAWHSLSDSGASLALGSDFPVERYEPLLGFYAAVTRQDLKGMPPTGWLPSERLRREQALHGFTLGAAYAAFSEQELGSLEEGKRADFIVLDRDIMQIPAAEILQARVMETWLNGSRVHSRE